MKKRLDLILPKVQKPSRYTGGEFGEILKDKEKVELRFAFCFPDTYEVGMSHLGMRILYGLINEREDTWCERCFAPTKDFEEILKEEKIPLFALESKDSLRKFDILGFTLQYELSYTNVLYMLELANIPLRATDRDERYPIVIGGGPCAVNAEPIADFFDLFVIGEAEEVINELLDLYKTEKKSCDGKQQFLIKAAQIEGVYVPSLYEVSYNEDGTVKEIIAKNEAPKKIRKRIIKDLDKAYYPQNTIVPFTEIVHDRVVLELFRGCIRGCRFCQAGMIYRPVREKSADTLNNYAKALCENTGYEELSLASLSSSDYSKIEELLLKILSWSEEKKINLTLPSLRVDNFSKELMQKIQKVRKSGLTFAPEAGTQRLRDVINKNITKEELLRTCQTAFEGGNTSVKLYFMIGLPTETNEDVVGIAELSQDVVNAYYNSSSKQKGKGVNVTVSVSSFIPKPFTPFQWEPQDSTTVLESKQRLLRDSIRTKKISLSYHDKNTSVLEAAFARGDRKLSAVIETAYKMGCTFDGWNEFFRFDLWKKAFEENNISMSFYANRRRSFDEILPWEHIDIGVSKKFLKKEALKAYEENTTPHCREKCSGCGANGLLGGKCNG
jgi:radical SAM family uncharacterized protein